MTYILTILRIFKDFYGVKIDIQSDEDLKNSFISKKHYFVPGSYFKFRKYLAQNTNQIAAGLYLGKGFMFFFQNNNIIGVFIYF